MKATLVELPGTINFRDFGGWPARAGARVRRGRLFRCGQLSGLAAGGGARLAALGIGVVCDLRRPDECAAAPSALGADAPHPVLVPIDPDHGLAESDIEDRIERRRTYMRELYRVLIARHTPDYARVFATLVRHAERGFLVHCTAGKDRTGVAAALILSALGVAREHVVADYLHTNDALDFDGFIAPRLRIEYGDPSIDGRAARALSGAESDMIEAALDEIDVRYGGFERYLADGLGVTAADLARLEASCLEP